MPLEAHIAHAFPTLIGRFQAPGEEARAVNAELRRLVLERERTVANDQHANAGGWHSPSDLLEWPSPAVKTLQGWIVESVNHMIKATLDYVKSAGLNKSFAGSLQLTAWANVSRKNNFHRLHNHPGNCWSGVYYVDSGDAADARQPLGGMLELIDPRPFTEMTFAPGEPYGQRIPIRPVAGQMVLFPSFLYHFVNPHQGEAERISIAFNARAIERKPAMNPMM